MVAGRGTLGVPPWKKEGQMANYKIHTKGTNKYDIEADDFTIVEDFFVFTAGQNADKVYAIRASIVARVERSES